MQGIGERRKAIATVMTKWMALNYRIYTEHGIKEMQIYASDIVRTKSRRAGTKMRIDLYDTDTKSIYDP